ncbi:unnamed protein product [Hermetia illucens]|uniref:Uncharacterized protein n=2 Tax=Hermetia illucens TaxID=343691 RepID=A0A7R8V555_HERIL|nr:uncharacterized protein LOC119658779 isoform X1 [Hermetia illucens]CAD7092863.1 unnamed protein product [Hermetia illucens]
MFDITFCGFLLLLSTFHNVVEASTYHVEIKSTAPAVIGARINFTAELYQDGKIAPRRQYNFRWSDSAFPKHTQSVETEEPFSNFSVIYDKSKYPARTYEMRVDVDRYFVGFYVNVAVGSLLFDINPLLSGNLTLTQNGKERPNDFVAIKVPTNQTITLSPSDAEFIRNATQITTYWFRNCTYLGPTAGLSSLNSYDKENESYELEALVEVSFEKIEPTTTAPPPTTTTTTKSTSAAPVTSPSPAPTPTSVPTTAAPAAKSSDEKNSNTVTTISPKSEGSGRRKREAETNSTIAVKTDVKTTVKPKPIEKEISASGEEIEVKQSAFNTTDKPIIETTTVSRSIDENFRNHPGSCLNFSDFYHDPNKTYGYFRREFKAIMPVNNVTITGGGWLQYGELLHLQVKCLGTKPFKYCIKIFEGPYNTTGNEKCTATVDLDPCEFTFQHLFQLSTTKTIAIIIENDYNKVVSQIAVNFYKAKKQSQLSVIVVPVSFSLVAVILVVFGVAYYIQNKNRYIIEVADFNFGDSQSVDMEYKTFQARLLDSIREVIPWPRRHVDNETAESHSGDDSSIKYGSMT